MGSVQLIEGDMLCLEQEDQQGWFILQDQHHQGQQQLSAAWQVAAEKKDQCKCDE